MYREKLGLPFSQVTKLVHKNVYIAVCPNYGWERFFHQQFFFVSTDLPDKRLRVTKSQQDLEELDDESTDIFKSNIIERYAIRPLDIPAVNDLCLAEFVAYYYKEYWKENSETIDAQPQVLTDSAIEAQHLDNDSLPDAKRLMNTNEKIKRRKIKAVIRYHKPNKHKEPELYFHHLLMLYYPWRHEGTLLGSNDTYVTKFYESYVKNIVEHNREMFEPDAETVTEALEWLRNNQNDIIHSYDSLGDQENEDIQLEAQDESLK